MLLKTNSSAFATVANFNGFSLGHLQENQEKHPIFNHQFHMFNPFLMGKSMVSGEDFSTNPFDDSKEFECPACAGCEFWPCGEYERRWDADEWLILLLPGKNHHWLVVWNINFIWNNNPI